MQPKKNLVPVSRESANDLIFVRSLTSGLSIILNKALQIVIAKNGLPCLERQAGQNICLSTTENHVWLSVCKADEKRTGIVRISPKRGVSISELSEEVHHVLKQIAKAYTIHNRPVNQSCHNLPTIHSQKPIGSLQKPPRKEVTGMTMSVKKASAKTVEVWKVLKRLAGDSGEVSQDRLQEVLAQTNLVNKPQLVPYIATLRNIGALEPGVRGKAEPWRLNQDVQVAVQARTSQADKTPAEQPVAPKKPTAPSPKELSADQLVALLGAPLNGGFPAKAIVDALLANRSNPAHQRALWRLHEINKATAARHDAPEFTENSGSINMITRTVSIITLE